MLLLEALDLDRVRVDCAVQYVDHNLLQEDHKNADDHAFLRSACDRYGIWYSPPGNGISHAVHMQRFGVPGASLVGSDSHTCAAGALGMLALAAGGADVAAAMTGRGVRLRRPEVWGVELTGRLPAWVSAKDVILEMLRRHGVAGGLNRAIEYHGDGVANLSVMDRHVIANMGAELGATTTVFPSDEVTQAHLAAEGRGDDWRSLRADAAARYAHEELIDLGALQLLIACPPSPDNVVPMSVVAGRTVHQGYIGSSANPGFRLCRGGADDGGPPTGELGLVRRQSDVAPNAGDARAHRASGVVDRSGCPSSPDRLQRLHRHGPGAGQRSGESAHGATQLSNRSGTRDDQVYLCSPETAAASALAGAIADPRGCGPELAPIHEPSDRAVDAAVLLPPSPARDARRPLVKGPNIGALPVLEPLPERLSLEVALCVGDDVSTDAILPAGSRTAASEQPRGDRALRFCRRGPRLRRPHQAAHSGAYDRRWQQLRAGVQP
jgi:aconitate hydratase